MIKFKLQFFGGDSEGTDRVSWADPDGKGYVDIPGLRDQTYRVPSSLFKQVNAKLFDSAKNETNEAKVIISYYLTYGEMPASNDGAEIHARSIRYLEGPNVPFEGTYAIDIKPNSDAYNKFVIPALKEAVAQGQVTDTEGDPLEKNSIMGGYVTKGEGPVGQTIQGVPVYSQGPDSYAVLKKGTKDKYTEVSSFKGADGKMYKADADGAFTSEKGDPVPPDINKADAEPLEKAKEDFNKYYNDLHSLEEGTLGKAILDNNISLFEKEARNAEILADTTLQANAMQQAQTIKQVTDSLRAERSAQLRAGMSEAQLADRELQMLMGSTNQLSQQAQMAAQDAAAAQLGQNTAREQAFNQYITQTTALGQNATGNYASLTSDAIAQAQILYDNMVAAGTPITMLESLTRTTGFDLSKTQ